ncbi:hypothetical protein HQ533_00255 [Candidatus Woesearchaeota archaeon]|nr:hypothetical protein [Candidatus Woesearchaeota archaeon]
MTKAKQHYVGLLVMVGIIAIIGIFALFSNKTCETTGGQAVKPGTFLSKESYIISSSMTKEDALKEIDDILKEKKVALKEIEKIKELIERVDFDKLKEGAIAFEDEEGNPIIESWGNACSSCGYAISAGRCNTACGGITKKKKLQIDIWF